MRSGNSLDIPSGRSRQTSNTSGDIPPLPSINIPSHGGSPSSIDSNVSDQTLLKTKEELRQLEERINRKIAELTENAKNALAKPPQLDEIEVLKFKNAELKREADAKADLNSELYRENQELKIYKKKIKELVGENNFEY